MPDLDILLESGRDLNGVVKDFYRNVKPLWVRRFLGVDLGRVNDPTAIALVEEAEVLTDFDHRGLAYGKERRLSVRHLERMPLGTPYPKVVERLKAIHTSFEPREQPEALVVDATGVGAPVVNLIKDARMCWAVVGVTITGGGQVSKGPDGYNVPKRDLITNLQLLLQQRLLKVAKELPDSQALAGELRQMRVKVTPFGQEQFACWREREHDDLVLAVALACWWVTVHCR
jgi:hypothetical protein